MKYEELIDGSTSLSVVGLGYVGLPLAVAFSQHVKVIGFDTNDYKISQYKNGNDITKEINDDTMLNNSNIKFTSKYEDLRQASFHIIAVPTPVTEEHKPDLTLIKKASEMVGKVLKKGSIVVYESTVYPGVTEEVCLPILEKNSGLTFGEDFTLGYSPERINPSDKEHVLSNIIKVVSGSDYDTLQTIAEIYSLVALAGVHKAPSIRVAEAAKVIENSQRDINIAFMNELSMIFDRLDINTKEVLEAAGTKWNFQKYTPGLVGGHCIGVDPYYLTYKANEVGYDSKIILSGREINDNMGKYIAKKAQELIKTSKENPRVAIFGFTFKENCQDTRNTKVIDIINELQDNNIDTIIVDPVADKSEAHKDYGIDIVNVNDVKNITAAIICVNHNEFKQLTYSDYDKLFKGNKKIIVDVKGIYNREEFELQGYTYWSL